MADSVFRAESGIYSGANSTFAANVAVTGNTTVVAVNAAGNITTTANFNANVGNVYANRVGIVNASNVSVAYQVYNSATNSIDTIFG